MPRAGSASEPEAVGFLLMPRFSMMAFVSAVEPLRVANRLAGRPLYRWEIVSADGAAVTASNGMALVADRGTGGPAVYAKLVVCAGFEPESAYDQKIAAWLRRANGAPPVGPLGQLDGRS